MASPAIALPTNTTQAWNLGWTETQGPIPVILLIYALAHSHSKVIFCLYPTRPPRAPHDHSALCGALLGIADCCMLILGKTMQGNGMGQVGEVVFSAPALVRARYSASVSSYVNRKENTILVMKCMV